MQKLRFLFYNNASWTPCALQGVKLTLTWRGNKTRDNLLTNETLLIKNYHRCWVNTHEAFNTFIYISIVIATSSVISYPIFRSTLLDMNKVIIYLDKVVTATADISNFLIPVHPQINPIFELVPLLSAEISNKCLTTGVHYYILISLKPKANSELDSITHDQY